jgi:1-acyl-sn-glycerol-3-phosphate acyltransferase
MSVTEWVVTGTLRRVSRILCRVDDHELARIPARGPLILVVNHVNFLDAPLMYSHLRPRPVTGFAKVETWDNPAMGWLFNVFQAIPLRRGEADTGAFRKALEVLARGEILGVAPEGTRSGAARRCSRRPITAASASTTTSADFSAPSSTSPSATPFISMTAARRSVARCATQ